MNRVFGFTFIEMLVVISIISAMSFFVVKNYSNSVKNTLVEQAAAQVVDIKRAALAYFVASGGWPNQEDECIYAAGILQSYMGPLGDNPWGFEMSISCPLLLVDPLMPVDREQIVQAVPVQTRPSLHIMQRVPNGVIAMHIAARLPSTEVRRDGGNFIVVTYVPMALLPAGTDHSNQIVQTESSLSFRVMSCPVGQAAEVILMPADICIHSSGGLFGFRLDAFTVENFDSHIKSVLFDIQDERGNWVNGFTACPHVEPRDAVRIYQYCTR